MRAYVLLRVWLLVWRVWIRVSCSGERRGEG